MASSAVDLVHLSSCVELSRRCPPSPSAYNVGAVLVSPAGGVLATGYSRELPGNTHAEGVALDRAAAAGAPTAGATLYVSMEPCGFRNSGLPDCATRCVRAGLFRVVYALREPPNLVPHPTGVAVLVEGGVRVDHVGDDGLARAVVEVNRHVLGGAAGAQS